MTVLLSSCNLCVMCLTDSAIILGREPTASISKMAQSLCEESLLYLHYSLNAKSQSVVDIKSVVPFLNRSCFIVVVVQVLPLCLFAVRPEILHKISSRI